MIQDKCNTKELIKEAEVSKAINFATEQDLMILPDFEDKFKKASSESGFYRPTDNRDWTAGFWTGELWLDYLNTGNEDFRQAAQVQIISFLNRIENKIDVDHHDMGFLYSPSCVAGYRITGNEAGKKAAVMAADQLISRFHPVGGYIQAWGRMDSPENNHLIIDSLLNLPLLYWAYEETGKNIYKEIADIHLKTTISNIIREDNSTWHKFYFDMKTGRPDHGATCQGYRDGSAWARGQAWGIYGIALNYRYAKKTEYLEAFEMVAQYFISHLPQDRVPYWDFEFHDGSKEPRDSSSAAIAACGMLEMAQFLPEEEKDYYNGTAKKILKSLYDNYRVKDHVSSNGLLLHGTYSKHSPYNTCNESGVDECTAWGDYFYLEAMTRLNGKLVSCW